MSARKKQQADRRDQIIKVAASLFADRGYHATGFEEIAQRLDVTRPSLYYHVDSKGAVLQEICDKAMEAMLHRVKTISESDVPPVDKLRNLLKEQLTFTATNKDLCTVLFDDSGMLDKKAQKKLREQKKSGEQFVQNIIRQGVEEGYFVFDDVKIASFLLLSACNWIYKWYQPDGRLTPEEIANKYIVFFEKGYIKQPRSRKPVTHKKKEGVIRK